MIKKRNGVESLPRGNGIDAQHELPPDALDAIPDPERIAPRPASKRERSGARKQAKTAAVKIHQIFFDEKHVPFLDKDMIPLDNSQHRDSLLEFGIFERIRATTPNKASALWGAVSWRFTEKTGLTGAQLIRAIGERAECDLYVCSPNPELESLYPNLWLQGNTTHPRFLELATAFFRANGLAEAQLTEIQPSVVFSNCNYFVANDKFWDAYLPFVRGLIENARKSLPRPMLKLINSSAADPRRLHNEATYWPFIIERLLPVFLKLHGPGLRVARIPPAGEAKLNTHLKRLREMKDVAHHTKSKWLAACWLHYRNSYVMNIASRDWCQTHLPGLTPKSIDFY